MSAQPSMPCSARQSGAYRSASSGHSLCGTLTSTRARRRPWRIPCRSGSPHHQHRRRRHAPALRQMQQPARMRLGRCPSRPRMSSAENSRPCPPPAGSPAPVRGHCGSARRGGSRARAAHAAARGRLRPGVRRRRVRVRAPAAARLAAASSAGSAAVMEDVVLRGNLQGAADRGEIVHGDGQGAVHVEHPVPHLGDLHIQSSRTRIRPS